MSRKPKTETHISRPMVLAAAILVGLAIAFVVYTAGRLGTRLDETAYHNMTSYAQQSASGINKMKTAYTSLCPIITVEANWRENRADTLRDMKSLMAGYEITSLCFIGDDGTGFDAQDAAVTRANLPFDAAKIPSLTQSWESDAYIGNSGRYEFTVQYPVTAGGVFLGDLYMGMSVNAQFNYLKNSNYKVFVVEEDTGNVIGSDGTTSVINGRTASIYRIIDNYSSESDRPDDAQAHDDAVNAVMAGDQTAILPIYYAETAQICCLTPVDGTHWYVCVTAETENIDGGKGDILALVYQLLFACVAAVIVLGVVYYLGQRQAIREQHKRMEVQEELNQKLNTALKAANAASQAKSDFLSNMSHDIRTPMNAIVGMTDLALENVNDPRQVTENLQVVRASSRHLLGLISDVLDLSRIESGQLVLAGEDFVLPDLLAEIVAIVQPMYGKRQQRFTFSSGDIRHGSLKGDPMRLRQILLNLLTNANKYTPEGGSIRFAVEEIVHPGDGKEGDAPVGWFRFTVADTGIGIAADKLESVFEPFCRETHSNLNTVEGTGLGLAIVRKIADAMGGTIAVDSEKGRGSVFTAELPFAIQEGGQGPAPLVEDGAGDQADGAAETPGAGPEPKAGPSEAGGAVLCFTGRRFLVADDHPVNRKIVKMMLKRDGADVDLAENGREAVAAFAAAPPGTYGAILMDVMMPVMGGYEATRAIRALDRPDAAGIPILALTANAFAEDLEKSREAGMDVHLAKPVDQEKLRKALNRFLK